VQHDVIGFERGVSFQLAAPVAFFMLLGEQAIARAVNGRGNPADQIVDLSETHLRQGSLRGPDVGGSDIE
jgi:hypothetical protein